MLRLVNCAGCQGRLRVTDNMLGRQLKCPACSAAIAIGAPALEIELEDSDVVEDHEAPAPVSLPLLSFDQLRIPARIRKLIEDALHDEEKLIWLGGPEFGRIFRTSLIAVPFGLVFTGLPMGALIWMIGAKTRNGLPLFGQIVIVVFLTVFALVGLIMFFLPVWVWILKNHRDCYVLTDRRALIVGWGNETGFLKYLRCTLVSYGPDQIQTMKRIGANLIFETKVQHGDTRKANSLWNRMQNRHYGDDQYVVKYERVKRGFLQLGNAEIVEKLIRQTLIH